MKMSDKKIPEDNGPVDGGTEVEQRKECCRCGNLCHKNEMELGEYLCASCFADLQELGRACSQSDSVKSKGTRVYRITSGNELFWAMYNPTNGDDIKEMARNFELNLIPVNVWEIQVQQKTSYLLVIGNITERSAPWIMKKIDPQAPTPNFKRILDRQTQNHIARAGLFLSLSWENPAGIG
jgi:hypothetical protein